MERAKCEDFALLLPSDPRLSKIGFMTILDSSKQKINKRAFVRFQSNKSDSLFKFSLKETLRKDDLIQYENVTLYAQSALIRPGVRLDPRNVPVGLSAHLRAEKRARSGEVRAASEAAQPLVIHGKSQNIIHAADTDTGEYKAFERKNGSESFQESKSLSQLRQERFALQATARDILKGELRKNDRGFDTPVFSVCNCNQIPISGGDGVAVKKGSRGSKFVGLQQCGSVWTCPVCSSKISEFRRSQVREMADKWQQSGKGLIFITNTIRHDRQDDLRLMLGALTGDTFNRYINSRKYKTARKELGYIGRIRALEVTYGSENGWHPHLHEIWFIEKPLNALELAKLQQKLFEVWNNTLIKSGFAPVTAERGLTVQNASNASDYLSKFGHQPKWDVGHEMTKTHSKKANNGKGFTPFDLLRMANEGDSHAAALFKEYAFAFFGKRQLFFSQGLKDFFQVKFLTDDEIMALSDPDEVLIMKISTPDWRLVRRFGRPSLILDLAETDHPVEAITLYINGLRQKSANYKIVERS